MVVSVRFVGPKSSTEGGDTLGSVNEKGPEPFGPTALVRLVVRGKLMAISGERPGVSPPSNHIAPPINPAEHPVIVEELMVALP